MTDTSEDMGPANGFVSRQLPVTGRDDDDGFMLLVRGAAQPFLVDQKTLAGCSEYFRAVLKYNEQEGQAYVEDVEPEAFARLLLLTSGKPVHLESVAEAVSTLQAGVKCLYPDLVQLSTDYLTTHMTADNVLQVLQETSQYCTEPSTGPSAPPVPLLAPCALLNQRCWDTVDAEATTVLSSPYLSQLSRELLLAIVRRDSLQVKSECIVFNAILVWGKEECRRRGMSPTGVHCRQVLSDILYEVRYLTMAPRHFRGVKASKVLASDEVNFLDARLKGMVAGPVPSTLEGRLELLSRPRGAAGAVDGRDSRRCDRLFMGLAHVVNAIFG